MSWCQLSTPLQNLSQGFSPHSLLRGDSGYGLRCFINVWLNLSLQTNYLCLISYARNCVDHIVQLIIKYFSRFSHACAIYKQLDIVVQFSDLGIVRYLAAYRQDWRLPTTPFRVNGSWNVLRSEFLYLDWPDCDHVWKIRRVHRYR